MMTSAILAITVALSDWLVFKSAKDLLLNSALSKMEGTLSLEIERITGKIDHARDQAEQLANSPIVQGFLFSQEKQQYDATTDTTGGEWRRHLEEHFSRLIQSNHYLQVRLIDAQSGIELVRVNSPKSGLIPEPVRGENLQNKGNTDYVNHGRLLKNGEVYISDITLNRENNQLVTPYQPTQRVVSPVFFDAEKYSSGSSLSVLDLAEQLRRYDQLRTLASMRIAQSGNLAWQNSYNQAIIKLSTILNKLEYLTSDEDTVSLEALKLGNTSLQESEQQIIDHASQGLLIEATRRIIGDHYWALKDNFKNTLEILISSLESEYITTSYKRKPKALLVINTDATALLSTLEYKSSETALLVNSLGQYIYHPDEKKRWGFEHNPETEDIRIDEPWVWQAISETHKPKLSFDEHGELHITGKVLFVNNDRHRFLGLVITKLEKDVLEPIQIFKTQSIYSSLFAILLSGLAIALFTHRQLKPISVLTQQAKLITAGQDNSTLKIRDAQGEVKTMADAFETLIAKLQQQTQEANENARAVSQLAETLDQKVKERTAALADSMHKAEAASIAKSQFMATMSHEIRTPMNGVLGMAQLLANTQLTGQQQDYLNTINQSGQALLSIINDILDFSKIESGKLDLEPIEFDLEHIAHEALHLLAATAEQKGLELIFNYDIHCPRHVKGDPGRIRQILINLIGNAVKFTEKGYVQLNIRYNSNDTSPLLFEAIDTGIGISEGQQKNLFDAFTQADASTTRRFGGTGLGLTISKRLIDLMGGTIGVKSEINKGTTFWFQLPLQPSKSPTPLAHANIKNVRALIVDDNHINCVILEDNLKYWGVDTLIATNQKIAINLLEQAVSDNAPIQLVLLDYMMPDCDGLALGKEIHQKYRIPQIMLTSASDHSSPDDLRAAGISICLSKPYSSKTLKNALEIALEDNNKALLLEPRSQYEIDEQRDTAPLNASLKGSILLVEDNLVNQEVAKGFLNQLGLSVDIAGDGVSAIECWKKSAYDLILMDCLMPIMDGFEASRTIRKNESGQKHTPIIALTANVMESDKQNCREAGMDDFVGKPIEQDELIEKLSYWLNQSLESQQDAVPIDTAPTSTAPTSTTPISTAPIDVALPDTNHLSDDLIVDESKFNSMSIQLKTRFQTILDAYIEESEALINELMSAGEQGNIETMVRTVHSLKSSSAALGAQQLSRLAEMLEGLYKAGEIENWQADSHHLSLVYQKTKLKMESLNETHLNS